MSLNFSTMLHKWLFLIVFSLMFMTSILGADHIVISNVGTDDGELLDGIINLADRPGETLFISTSTIESILAQDINVEITASISISHLSAETINFQNTLATLALYTILGDITIQSTIDSGLGELIISSGGTAHIISTITSLGDISLSGEEIDINGDIDITSGNLTMTAVTGITASSSSILSISGTSTITTSMGDITLDNLSNDFIGPVNATGDTVILADANSLALGTIEATTLTVKAGTATVISAQSDINVATSSSFETF